MDPRNQKFDPFYKEERKLSKKQKNDYLEGKKLWIRSKFEYIETKSKKYTIAENEHFVIMMALQLFTTAALPLTAIPFFTKMINNFNKNSKINSIEKSRKEMVDFV